MPLPDIEAGTGPGPALAGVETGDADVPPAVPTLVLPEVPPVPDPASSRQAAPARQTAELAEAESLRLAAQMEQEAQRQAHESERLAAERADQDRRAREQLAFEQARQQADALRLVEERRLLQLAELQRDEKARAEKEGEESELARRADEERQRMAREEAQRRHAEEARQQLAQQLVQRQREDALRLAREQTEHRAAEDAARARTALAVPGRHEAAAAGAGAAAAASNAPGPGAVAGAGGRAGAAPGDLPAGAFGSRAREMLRGVAIPGIVAPPVPPQGLADGRRVLADGAERDVPLRLYVASVRQKLERNAVLGGARFASRELRIDPLVSLSLRSDGSVEDVTIVRSSGRPDMDEAVRRFVRLNARYSAFPPNVAARFDIIEIRRVWTFADGLKLLEELR